MPNVFRINGVQADLQWGYHRAGLIRDWSVEGVPGAWTLTGTLVVVDTYRVSQRPLVIVARHAKGAWTWDVTTLQITGSKLTASIRPQERPTDVEPRTDQSQDAALHYAARDPAAPE